MECRTRSWSIEGLLIPQSTLAPCGHISAIRGICGMTGAEVNFMHLGSREIPTTSFSYQPSQLMDLLDVTSFRL